MAKRLNDLSGREWLPATRSAIIDGVARPAQQLDLQTLPVTDSQFAAQSILSTATRRPENKLQHPATFPESDAQRLVKLFTQTEEAVLDPFMGTGSTAVACIEEQRRCLGFELYPAWADIARERIADALDRVALGYPLPSPMILATDALDGLGTLADQSQDFILTSPPYWGILQKKDHKARTERESNGLATDYGGDPNDISQVESYDEFLHILERHFREWHRVLRSRAYAAVIVSDFRHGSKYYPFHAHVGEHLEHAGFQLQGLIIIVQDSKRLYPYGYPTTYVPNICNQFVVVGRKCDDDVPR